MHPLAQILSKPKVFSLILGLLAQSPLRTHTEQEIRMRLKSSKQQTLDALNELSTLGWIKKFEKNGREYFSYNIRFRPAAELRQALQKGKAQPQDKLTSALKKLGRLKAVFLSGIFTAQSHSPIDLLIVGQPKQEQLQMLIVSCRKIYGQEINYSIMSEDEFIRRRNTFDRFIRDIFDYPYLTIVDQL